MQTTSTPCVAVCRVDPVSGLCIGCGRSREEIAAWVSLEQEERVALMARLPARFDDEPALGRARADWDAFVAERPRRGRRARV